MIRNIVTQKELQPGTHSKSRCPR